MYFTKKASNFRKNNPMEYYVVVSLLSDINSTITVILNNFHGLGPGDPFRLISMEILPIIQEYYRLLPHTTLALQLLENTEEITKG